MCPYCEHALKGERAVCPNEACKRKLPERLDACPRCKDTEEIIEIDMETAAGIEPRPSLWPYHVMLAPILSSIGLLGRDEGGTVLHREGTDFLDEWGIVDRRERGLWRHFWGVITNEQAQVRAKQMATISGKRE